MLDALTLELSWSPLPSDRHRAWFRHQPSSCSSTLALLGGYGSGKTVTALRRYVIECLRRPWVPAYGAENPTSLVMAPTGPILKTMTLPMLEATIPPELVLRRIKSPPVSFDLVTGHRILALSAAGSMEGLSITHAYLDEIDHAEWTTHPARYTNAQARLRDARATHPFLMIVTGLARAGRVRDLFGPLEEPGPEGWCLRLATRDNSYLDPEAIAAMRRATPADEVACLIDGQWGAEPDASFPSFSEALHVVSDAGDKSRPVHLGIDVGRRSVALLGQPWARGSIKDGLLVVDEVLTYDSTVGELCALVAKRGWKITSDSSISVDPKMRITEIRALRDAFPAARMILRGRKDPWEAEEPGLRLLSSALLNGAGETRLWFSSAIRGPVEGVLSSVIYARRHPITGRIVRTKDTGRGSDHAIDALRYLAVTVLAAPPGFMRK